MFQTPIFRFFAYLNITKFCRSIHFPLVTLICQKNLQQLFILLLKQSFLQMAFKYLFLGFKIYSDVKKLLRGHQAILSYLGPKLPQIQSR